MREEIMENAEICGVLGVVFLGISAVLACIGSCIKPTPPEVEPEKPAEPTAK
jgi:hypothetical protein